mmetsp:Transcript_15021/g.35426  ORF Transcript_15021/g.35426 Transcript_15021/m.35426 type:complete len:221 (-) Transcript_15021:891-1553(-)
MSELGGCVRHCCRNGTIKLAVENCSTSTAAVSWSSSSPSVSRYPVVLSRRGPRDPMPNPRSSKTLVSAASSAARKFCRTSASACGNADDTGVHGGISLSLGGGLGLVERGEDRSPTVGDVPGRTGEGIDRPGDVRGREDSRGVRRSLSLGLDLEGLDRERGESADNNRFLLEPMRLAPLVRTGRGGGGSSLVANRKSSSTIRPSCRSQNESNAIRLWANE